MNSYQVILSFDLQSATREDYNKAYAAADQLGLKRQLQGTSKVVTLPTTMCLGPWNGTTVDAVRDAVRDKVRDAFVALGLTYEIFVAVGGPESTWAHTTNKK